MTTIPHFDMPFRFSTAGQHAAVVEQDSGDDVTNCVETTMRTTRGSRMFVPLFGITDPVFNIKPLPQFITDRMQQEVEQSEPRATTHFTDLGDVLDAMIANIVVEVSNE